MVYNCNSRSSSKLLFLCSSTQYLSKVQIENSDGSNIYGNYTNLKGISITKMLTDQSIIINLEETTITQ